MLKPWVTGLLIRVGSTSLRDQFAAPRLGAVNVERIRQKVVEGLKLSDDELRALQGAAQAEGGPSLRTAVAQALINAGAAEQSIPLLEAVRRDFPRDLQANLALARALISLERWSDAQSPLERALALNPADPEANKALAVIAMRRAEWARARALVEEVLMVDPFDSEAQLLSTELDQVAPGEVRGAPSLAEFIRALVAELKARSTPHLVQKQQVMVRIGKGAVVRLDLGALHHDFVSSGQTLASAIVAIAKELSERTLGLPEGRLQLLSRVLPVLRESSFLERGIGAARREGPASLWFFYAIDDPELVRYVPEGALDGWRISLEELDDTAWKNLEARSTEVRALELEQGALRLSTTPTGLWALAHGDGHDGARLLTASHQAAIAKVVGPGPYRVYLGLRELVLICLEHDAASVAKIDDLDSARDGIAGVWRLDTGRLTQLGEWSEIETLA